MKRALGFFALIGILGGIAYFSICACSAKPLDPPTKIEPAFAARLDYDVSQFRAIQAQAQAATQAITQMANEAAQPIVDDLDEICKAGKFSLEDVVQGRVRVNAKTGEITRVPKTEAKAAPPTK